MKKETGKTYADYLYYQQITTRWKDNDIYGHVNNVEYYSFFDTVINKWLIDTAGMDIHNGDEIAVCAESNCRYLSPVSFPHTIEAGLRVVHIGRSSVRYEIGLFEQDTDKLIADGWFVHVFVDREKRQPTAIPAKLKEAMQKIFKAGEEA